MSTRAIIAEPHGDTWRGRHVHSDGYPTWQGRQYWALVQRHGVEAVRRRMIHEFYGWSCVDPGQPDLSGVTPDKDAGYDTPEFQAYMHAPGGMYGDGRFVSIPGWGVAYTHAPQSDQSSESDWYGPHEEWGFSDKEWAYVLADDAMYVYKLPWNGTVATLIGSYRWDGEEPDWSAVEKAAYDDSE